jgi:hypothetical protein
MIPDPLERIERTTQEMNAYMHKHNRTVFDRYPLLFSFLGTFGFVCILFGIEEILNEISFVREYPAVLLLMGVIILILTGSLYKRLEKDFF